MDYFVGLDLSLTGSGVVVLDSKGDVEFAETIKTNQSGEQRLVTIKDRIITIVSDCQPEMICIENYAMGIRAGQSFSIGELGGVIKVGLYQQGHAFTLVTPTRLKKYITGKGVAEKDMILLSVYKNFGYEAKDNNVADAYGLAHIARSLHKEPSDLRAYQKEVIYDLHHPEEAKTKKKK